MKLAKNKADKALLSISSGITLTFLLVLIVTWISTGIFSIAYSILVLLSSIMSAGTILALKDKLSNHYLAKGTSLVPKRARGTLCFSSLILVLLALFGYPYTWLAYLASVPFTVLGSKLLQREKRNRGIH